MVSSQFVLMSKPCVYLRIRVAHFCWGCKSRRGHRCKGLSSCAAGPFHLHSASWHSAVWMATKQCRVLKRLPSWGLHGPAALDLAVTSGLRSGAMPTRAVDGARPRPCLDYEARKRAHQDTARLGANGSADLGNAGLPHCGPHWAFCGACCGAAPAILECGIAAGERQSGPATHAVHRGGCSLVAASLGLRAPVDFWHVHFCIPFLFSWDVSFRSSPDRCRGTFSFDHFLPD